MLIVTNPFAGYGKGDQIAPEDEDKVLASENATSVVRVADAAADKPKTTRTPEKAQ